MYWLSRRGAPNALRSLIITFISFKCFPIDNLAAPRVGNGVIDDVDTGGEADGRCCQPKTQVRNLENIIFLIFFRLWLYHLTFPLGTASSGK